VSCAEDALLRAGKAEGDARARQLAASARDGLLLKKFAMPQLVSAFFQRCYNRTPWLV
jgi:hypothetical protein